MKIADVRRLAIGSAWRNLSIVVVRTDDGLEGVGEVRMVNHSRALAGYLDHAIPVHVIGHGPSASPSTAFWAGSSGIASRLTPTAGTPSNARPRPSTPGRAK